MVFKSDNNLLPDAGLLLEIIKNKSQEAGRRDAAVSLLNSINAGKKISKDFYNEIFTAYQSEPTLEISTVLKRILNKIKLIGFFDKDPVKEYDRKLTDEEFEKIKNLYDEIKGEEGTFNKNYRTLTLNVLGEGGFCEIYKSLRISDNRVVAIKCLLEKHDKKRKIIERFRREAEILVNLRHEHIVEAYEYGISNGRYFIVMEYLEGKSLKERIDDEGLSFDEFIKILYQVIDGLDAVHKKGLVHRDVKPDNIMVSQQGKVKIVDFNLAKDSNKRHITLTGREMGTEHYKSPEQIEGREDIDLRSDIYSLGVMIYYCLTGGKYPPVGSYLKVSDLDNEVPDEMDEIIKKCIRYKREERWQCVEDIKEELNKIQPVS